MSGSTRFLPPQAVSFLRHTAVRGLGLGLLLFSLGLGLALLSYQPTDSSWNTAGAAPVANWMGPVGAVIADIVSQILGLSCFLLPLALGIWGWKLARHGGLFAPWWRCGLLVVALPVWSLVAAAWGDAGGIVGASLLGGVGGEFLPVWALGALFFCLGLILVGPPLYLGWQDWKRVGGAIWRGLAYVWGLTPPQLPARKTRASAAAKRRKRRKVPAPSTGHDAASSAYVPPPLSLLQAPANRATSHRRLSTAEASRNAKRLEKILADFNVHGTIAQVHPGPIITLYELHPAPGTKAARVVGLAGDIARSMSALSARIAPIPGRDAIGIELPNPDRDTVYLREQLETPAFADSKTLLPLALGKDIGGGPVIADLAAMPHLLIAGTTGSGKSVAVNAMILSLLYRLSPQECRLVMIDPKMLELSVYDDIPHLLSPVVTEPKKAVLALKWTVREMERRYHMMSHMGVRGITAFNERAARARQCGEVLTRRVQTGFDSETNRPVFEDVPLDLSPLPLIVVVVDEMADLMMTAGKEIEAAIQRLSQMARAAGIHLIMATQRPSVDVITGTIKANFPTRVSFQVTSKIDSRTILGEQGAEQLLGQGDMLYMAVGKRMQRVHSPFVSDFEVERVVGHLRAQGMPEYMEDITKDTAEDSALESGLIDTESSQDHLYNQAVEIVTREGKASTSFVQRHLQIGYNRAARLIDRMESEGVIGPANHVGKREVFVNR